MNRLTPWMLCLLTAGAAAQDPPDTSAGPPVEAAAVGAAALPVDAHATRIDSMLIHALSLIGVKYRFGGNSFDAGFDCSGFVRHVFAETVSLELPRNTFAMSKLGMAVERDALLPGDLLFYNTLGRSHSHVGIYIGEGRFVHAPSRGKVVEIIDMSDRYWTRRYNGARRLVDR